MTITRFLLPGVVLGAFAVPCSAQFGGPSGPGYSLVPSVRPASANDPLVPLGQPLPATGRPATVQSLEQMSVPHPGGPVVGDPVGTLNGAPTQYAAGLPPGSYPSPYYTDGPGCCGPLGADGRVGYEVYTYTGANFAFGPGLPAKLRTGITIGAGARTLFFTPDHTAAWTIDLGGSFTHNNAAHSPQQLFLRANPIVNTATGTSTPVPDPLRPAYIRELYRESFNFNFGRDWWLWGAGNTGGETGTNIRVGTWVGGRWGTSHVDQIPLDEPDGYSRRQNVYEGVVVGAHATFETPVGGWILFGGARLEYGYDWTNLVPPLQGNLNNLNVQLTLGIRF